MLKRDHAGHNQLLELRGDDPDDHRGGYGEARPIPEQSQYVQVQLPTGPVRATPVLLIVNVAIFLLSGFLSIWVTGSAGALFTPAPEVLRFLGWKENALILQGAYWRLLTAMFLHGNLLHILFNGYALYILGPETERIYGTSRFLSVYFLAGLAGSVASYALSRSPSVGASGAIFGLIGGLGVFFYLNRAVLGAFGRSQLQAMIAIVVLNLLFGLSARGVIDNFAHIGGLLGGVVAGWLLAPRYVLDRNLFPPVVVRHFQPMSWSGAAALLLALALLVALVRPPF